MIFQTQRSEQKMGFMERLLISGATRDTAEVKKLGFPVFSTGSVCTDVRKRATIESYNKQIEINGVKINPDDLIFGDNEGVIVIPRRYEAKIIEKAFEVITNEKNILVDIANGLDVTRIVSKYGFF